MRLIILALARFDDDNTSTTFQLAKCFGKMEHETFIVEHPFTWFELIRSLCTSKGWIRLKATFKWSPTSIHKDGYVILVPPAVLPINFLPKGTIYQFFSRLNQNLLAVAINKVLKRNHWEEYHYVNSYNYHFPMMPVYLRSTPLSNTYHCVDPMVKNYTKKHGISNELLAVKTSDKVINTAPNLKKKWQGINESFLVPNAVDFNHFNKPLRETEHLRNIGDKVVGYFGNIERRIDYDLLIETFSNNPGWQLVLAGPVEEKYVPKELKMMDNVHFTGPYSYEELPHLMNSIDATIIPFKCDQVSSSIYPLKLYEYFSVGKPTISTLFNPDILEGLRNDMYLIDDKQNPDQAVGRALRENDPEIRDRRKRIASQNTWDQRAELFLEMISNNQKH